MNRPWRLAGGADGRQAATMADLALPPALAALLLAPLLGLGLDVSLSARFYDPAAGGFALWHDWLLEKVLHDWVKLAARTAALLLLAAACASLFLERLRPLRRLLWFVVAGLALSATVVSAIKQSSAQACPVGLAMFGGSEPLVGLFDAVPAGLRAGRCWPGGHAASAFSFFPLYFAARHGRRPRLARRILGAILLFGLVLSLVQVARGAHFFSHQVWTALICWYASLAAYWLAFAAPGPARCAAAFREAVAPAGAPRRQE